MGSVSMHILIIFVPWLISVWVCSCAAAPYIYITDFEVYQAHPRNRAVDEWLGIFNAPILGNSALCRLANASYQIVIEG